ncbi:hypothetical protein FGO68_gene16118 [Halteria grandinella]|uniref:Uncharacterized protein n=1 Tax=Halteria grandinella TaxID=5974 RepID=A0A8J8SZY9_HALGN|nr:hypothetical protein FGO68_gene16118 [Halteria grandinella]
MSSNFQLLHYQNLQYGIAEPRIQFTEPRQNQAPISCNPNPCQSLPWQARTRVHTQCEQNLPSSSSKALQSY